MTYVECPDTSLSAAGSLTVFGRPYLELNSCAGNQVLLSSDGAERLDRDRAFQKLFERTVDFVDRHGRYGDTAAIRDFEPGTIYRVSDNQRGVQSTYSSVYAPAAADGSIVIKAYDFTPRHDAPAQFFLNGYLARRAIDAVSVPAPLAMITSDKGHQTVIMERAAGQQLRRALQTIDWRDGTAAGDRAAQRSRELVSSQLGRMLGTLNCCVLRDLNNCNILVSDEPTETKFADCQFAVIDQPKPLGSRFVGLLARLSTRHHRG